MHKINYEQIDEIKKLTLTDNLMLSYNRSKKDLTIFDKSEEEEITLDNHNSNILFATKINNNYFLSLSADNMINIWSFQGKLIACIDEHENSVLGIKITENGIYSISKNDKIIFSGLLGKYNYVIDEKIDSLDNLEFWSDSIHTLKDNGLLVYDTSTGKEIILFENQNDFIDKFHRLKNDNILTLSDGKVTLWDSSGKKINNLHITFDFSKIIELENHKLAILADDKVYIFDENCNIESSTNNSEIVREFKKLIESTFQLNKYKNEKTSISQFPHIFNPFSKKMPNSIDEIKNQELNFNGEKHDKKVWDFFNRPLFTPIKKLLKKEENRTKRYIKNISNNIDKTEKEILDTELLLEKENKSLKLITMFMLISLIVGSGLGLLVAKPAYGILILSVISIFLIFSKKTAITNYNTLIEQLKSELQTLNILIDISSHFISNLKQYRNSIINQIPVVNDTSLFTGEYVNKYINNLIFNDINDIAMNECGLIQEDIIHVEQKAIVLNDWSLVQSNISKVNEHNIHSFWGTKHGIIFATQFLQYIFLTKDKIDVFNTHYDFIQNKFIRKEAHAFYYKDVTNITKKEVDRKLTGDDDITPATEITLKVSSGDSIELTILNDDTLTKLNNSSVEVENDNDEKIDKLYSEQKEIENDDSLSDEEKNEELRFISAQINDLESKECISSSTVNETNKVDTTIQNIRAQIKAHKE